MRRSTAVRVPFAVLLSALALACSEDEPDFVPGTPREAIFEFNRGLAELDKPLARSWVLPGAVQDELFEAIYGMAEIVQGFKRRVREVYGEEGMRLVGTEPGAHLHQLETHADEQRLKDMVVREFGEVAMATFPDGQQMRVERSQGAWRVNLLGSDNPEDIHLMQELLGPQMVLALLLRDYTAKVGADGLSAEEFDLKLGRYIQQGFEEIQRQQEAAAQQQAPPEPPAHAPPAPAPPADRQVPVPP